MRILTVVVAAACLASQAAGTSIAGRWTAQFEARTFVTVELTSANGTVTGLISLGDVEVDKQGALRRVREPQRKPTPIFEVSQTGSTLRFAVKDGNDTDLFELRVLDEGRAELRMLLSDHDVKALAAEGVGVPKPFALTRQAKD
jgi:hypothetical protein